MISDRVVRRYLQRTGGWLNQMNGTFFALLWDRTKWHLEEMENGEPMPTTIGFGDNIPVVTYEMPVLDKAIKAQMGPQYSLGVDTVKTFARLKATLKGPEARTEIIRAHEEVFGLMGKDIAPGSEEDRRLKAILPELRRKLVWKRKK